MDRKLEIGDVVVLKSTMMDTTINDGKGYPQMTVVENDMPGILSVHCVRFNPESSFNSANTRMGTFVYNYFSPNSLQLYIK